MKENKNNMNANELTNKQKSNTLLHRLQVHKLSKSKNISKQIQNSRYLLLQRQARQTANLDGHQKLLRPGRSIGSLDGCESRQPMCIPNEVIL